MPFAPITLFNLANAGATRSKLLFPGGVYTCTLPALGSGAIAVASLTDGTNQVGAVFSPHPGWGSVLLDFAGVGAADEVLAVEIGRFHATGTLTHVIGSVSLKAITTSGTTTANFNPFTGAAVATTTFRLFDLATITSRGARNQLLLNLGGTEDQTPAQLLLDVTEANYYYVAVTSLGALTRALCVVTGQDKSRSPVMIGATV